MTTIADPPRPGALDVRTFLLGDNGPAGLRAPLEEVLSKGSWGKALGVLPGKARRALHEELAELTAGLLDLDLGTIAMSGWRLHGQLVTAARATLVTAGLTERVELADHRITSAWSPHIEVQFAGAAVARLELELTVSFAITALSATVTAGRLTRLGGGHGTVSASLSMSGQPLVERTAPFDAHLSVALGRGLPLSEVPEPRTSPSVIDLTDRAETAPAQA